MKTYLYKASNLKSTITFLASDSYRKSISGAHQKPSFLVVFHSNILEYTEVIATSLLHIILPESCAFIIGFSCTV